MTTDPWYGRDLGGYRVGDELGTALGGELYAAQQLARGRPVIMKIVDPTVAVASGFRGRFERDVALLGSFFHPHVVTLYGAGTVEGTSFLAMRPDDDPTLEELIAQDGALDTPRATALVAQVASALDAAHQRGLVHRGLSPASILVRAGDDGVQAALTDFAVADDTAGYGGLFEPPAGTAPPPIDYAAPEQVRGDPTTPATDLYALGAILFHALTGFAPFSDLPRGATLEAHVSAPVPRATALVFDLAPSFDDLFARALAKDPARRFASGAELVAAIPAAERAAPRRAAAVSRPVAAPWAGAVVPPERPAAGAAATPQPAGAPGAPSERPAVAASEPSRPSRDAPPAVPLDPPGGSRAAASDTSAQAPAPPPGAAQPPPDEPPPAFHFLQADGYDPRVGSANYGPEEPGLEPVAGADPDPAATQAFDAALAAAVDIDDADLDEDDALSPPDADPDLDALLAAAKGAAAADGSAGAAAADPLAEPGATEPGRRGMRARKRRPPDIEPIENPVRPPRRRRRRRRPGVALIAAGVLLLIAGVCVLVAGGLFDGGDDGATPKATTSAAKRTEADALADLRGDTTTSAAEPATPPPPTSRDASPPPASQDSSPPPAAASGDAAAVSSWPADRHGFTTVVFTSPTDRATARERAQQAAQLGLRSGVLRSDDFENLEPGVWVTFAGVSSSEAGAERIVDDVRKAGLAAEPYVRRIDPR